MAWIKPPNDERFNGGEDLGTRESRSDHIAGTRTDWLTQCSKPKLLVWILANRPSNAVTVHNTAVHQHIALHPSKFDWYAKQFGALTGTFVRSMCLL